MCRMKAGWSQELPQAMVVEGFYNEVLEGERWDEVSKSMWHRQIAGVMKEVAVMKWPALEVEYRFILEEPVNSLATKNKNNGLEVIQSQPLSEGEHFKQED